MKKVIIFLAVIVFVVNVYGQAINSFNYQAIVRDTEGEVMANEQVNLTVNLLQGSATGTVVYSEAHDSATNDFGLVNLNIGTGNPNNFSNIDWNDGPYFINLELDGNSIGTTQLLSVPYALQAETANNLIGMDTLSSYLLNELTNMSKEIEYLRNVSGKIGKITDINGNEYKTIKIDSQIWMAENLRVTHYADSTPIPYITDYTEWADLGDNDTDKGFCYYDNDTNSKYGALYTWAAAMNGDPSSDTNPSGVQGVCPDGWHLPSNAEWEQLIDYSVSNGYTGEEAKPLKSTYGWDDIANETGNGTNVFGFSALPGGRRYEVVGGFDLKGTEGYWWSSTEHNSIYAYYKAMGLNDDMGILKHYNGKSWGYSVRCVKNLE